MQDGEPAGDGPEDIAAADRGDATGGAASSAAEPESRAARRRETKRESHMNPLDRVRERTDALEAVPGLARIAFGAWYRTAAWSLGVWLHSAERLGELATSPESPARAAERLRAEASEAAESARHILGVAPASPDGSRPGHRPGNGSALANGARSRGRRRPTLRERGAELLERAADLSDDVPNTHPGFERIVDQLAPDEARILRLLINAGPQGIVYVNQSAPFGIGAREVARRLSMIGHEAGCLHNELVPAYLDNLVSHGLLAIRRDALADEVPYQVIEAQPEVLEAMETAAGRLFRGHITRRSVHLTDFGRAFCRACFPPEHLPPEERVAAVEEDDATQLVPPTPEPD